MLVSTRGLLGCSWRTIRALGYRDGCERLLCGRSPRVAALATQAALRTDRERMNYDLVVVGAGPAGLSAAIRFRQLNPDASVCVLEKGAEVGAHILSGNVFEPRALDELLPDWRERGVPLGAPARDDHFFFLTESSSFRLPTPPQMHNAGNYVVSLSEVTRWLGEQAEEAGVEIYAGFPASELLTDSATGRVTGVATNDMGIGKDGARKAGFEPGVEINGQLTFLAEGARGSLTQEAVGRFNLRGANGADEQTYALGLKEVWRVDPAVHSEGTIWHSIGYPLDSSTYGGSFLYHMSECRVAVGYVVALDYKNPFLSPHGEFQRFKAHPLIRPVLEGGQVLQYGARTLNEGGLQSIPKLEFPGGALIGCAAGFLNVPKIKGTHTAMKSGMLAAEAAHSALTAAGDDAAAGAVQLDGGYESALRNSWVWSELRAVRNIRPGFKYGLVPGLLNAAFETYISRGRSPWTLHHAEPDHQATEPAAKHTPIHYPTPDGKVTFDILTSVAMSGTNHDHDERCHLVLGDDSRPSQVNHVVYGGLEGRYCPAKVYEYLECEDGTGGGAKLQINAQNCLHCKACDIKDPTQNITWTCPEGGGGPKYTIS
jgi:electron-transferring-flavoprotein dehydrogenase